MKENNKRILLALYNDQNEPLWISKTSLQALCPQLSTTGFRSALFLLEKRKFLQVDASISPPRYSLSSYGKSFLEGLFPALLTADVKEAQSALVVFLQAPKSDRNFRYLRTFLLDKQAVALTRAVFLLPAGLSAEVKLELERSYQGLVVVFGLQKWLLGDELQIIGQKVNVQDLLSLYSGLSKEIDRLLSMKNDEKTLMIQDKQQLSSAFDRFMTILAADKAALQAYFPQVVWAKEILKALQKLLLL